MVVSLIKKNSDKLFLTFIVLATLSPRFGAIDNNAIRWFLLSIISFAFLSNKLNLGSLKILNRHIYFSALMISYLIFSIIMSNNSVEGIISLYKIINLIVVFFICSDIFKKTNSPFITLCVIFSISLFIEGTYTLIQFFSSSGNLTGVASNANISSSSIIIKLPFINFLSYQLLGKRKVLFLKIIELLSILGVIILGSRLGVLSLFLIYFLIFLFYKNQRIAQVFPLLIIIAFSFYINTSDPSDRLKIDTLTIENLSKDESTNQRLNFYRTALDKSYKKPIFGYGLGSWKYESLGYKEDNEYKILVPYYTHNDFLQILFELGIIGLVIYLSFLISVLRKIILLDKRYKGVLIIALIIFLINSLLNFPIHRSQEILPFIIISAFIFSIGLKTNRQKKGKVAYYVLFGLILPGIALSYLEHNSLKIQGKLISDYNKNLFSLNNDELNKINYHIPNLAANVVPISTYLSRYYLEQKKYDKSLSLLNFSIKANYKDLMTQELLLKNYIFNSKNDLAFFQAKKLVNSYPSNLLYAEIYFSLINDLKLEDELSVDLLTNNQNIDFHLMFFKTVQKFDSLDGETKKNLLHKSLEIFPTNKELLKLLSVTNE